ncbi:MAG: SDR family oxidoreductase [Clostridiales bacterium]|nr:SDR family oxidoreductase [Clostridiales bacterium]
MGTITLEGKIAIITGAGMGLGYAEAQKFLELGAKVAVCDVSEDALNKAVEQLSAYGEVTGYKCNVASKEEVEAMVKAVAENYGRIDILVNNAGIVRDAQFYKMTDDQWHAVIDVNLNGTYYCAKAVIPYMMEQKYGKILNTSSISALNGNFGQSNYAASKNAIIGMTRVMGKELGKYNINVNAILPGSIDTPMAKAMRPEFQEMRIKQTALRRLGDPEDLANAAAFLCSEWARHITAQTLTVDAGRS